MIMPIYYIMKIAFMPRLKIHFWAVHSRSLNASAYRVPKPLSVFFSDEGELFADSTRVTKIDPTIEEVNKISRKSPLKVSTFESEVEHSTYHNPTSQ